VEDGYPVKGSTTTSDKLPALHAADIEPYLLTLSPHLEGDRTDAFFMSDVLFLNVPPPRGRDDLRAYHLRQIESVIDAADAVDWVIFASSTGVYPQKRGPVTEEDVPSPDDSDARAQLRPTGAALLDAERLLQSASAFDTTVVRFAGLYGGDRDPGRFLAGRERVSGGDAPVNLIHRDDCLGVVRAILEQDARGEVFNACADEHPIRRVLYTSAAQRLGIEPPTFESGGTNKVVSNAKVKQMLDYRMQHPDPAKG
jgi:nucleoside-diphosphate-sugar epimerase